MQMIGTYITKVEEIMNVLKHGHRPSIFALDLYKIKLVLFKQIIFIFDIYTNQKTNCICLFARLQKNKGKGL